MYNIKKTIILAVLSISTLSCKLLKKKKQEFVSSTNSEKKEQASWIRDTSPVIIGACLLFGGAYLKNYLNGEEGNSVEITNTGNTTQRQTQEQVNDPLHTEQASGKRSSIDLGNKSTVQSKYPDPVQDTTTPTTKVTKNKPSILDDSEEEFTNQWNNSNKSSTELLYMSSISPTIHKHEDTVNSLIIQGDQVIKDVEDMQQLSIEEEDEQKSNEDINYDNTSFKKEFKKAINLLDTKPILADNNSIKVVQTNSRGHDNFKSVSRKKNKKPNKKVAPIKIGVSNTTTTRERRLSLTSLTDTNNFASIENNSTKSRTVYNKNGFDIKGIHKITGKKWDEAGVDDRLKITKIGIFNDYCNKNNINRKVPKNREWVKIKREIRRKNNTNKKSKN